MAQDIVEIRVKPAENYGLTRRVKLSAELTNKTMIPKNASRLHFEYDDLKVLVYNPQRLSFDVNIVISAIQTIYGKAKSIYGENNNE